MNYKNLLLILSFILLLGNDIYAQRSIQLTDMELLDLGDGQMFGQELGKGKNRNIDKTPLNGKVRIITGYTTEYIDAEFSEGKAIGKWEYYNNNNLASSTNYKDGYEEGEKTTYYNDGKTVKSKATLAKGKVNGVAIAYDQNGKKEYEKSLKNGVDDGSERYFSPEGEILSETIFKDGKAEGKSFSTIGKGSSSCYVQTQYYTNGQLEGEYSEVFCDGTPKVKGKYVAGKKDGLWEQFNKEGKRNKPSEVYANDELIKKTTYYANGKIEKELNYKEGKEDGIQKHFTQEGTLKSEKNYARGKQVGRQVQQYTSSDGGFTETSYFSAEGKKNGEFSEIYTETNTVKTKGQYVNGEKDGKWVSSTKDGDYTKETNYAKGKELNAKVTQTSRAFEPSQSTTSVTLYDGDGNKNGEFIETYLQTKKVREKGMYSKGRKTGKWITYDTNGAVKNEYVYENGSIVSY